MTQQKAEAMEHGELIEREPDYAAEMRLPVGATCDGCVHARRCFGLGFSRAGATSCDFHPSRYRTQDQGDGHE
jgi:hypothetical protein